MNAAILQDRIPSHASLELGGNEPDNLWIDAIYIGRTGLVEVHNGALPMLPREEPAVQRRRCLTLSLHSLGMTLEETRQALGEQFSNVQEDKERIFRRLKAGGWGAGALAVSLAFESGFFNLRSLAEPIKEIDPKYTKLLPGIAKGLTNEEIAKTMYSTENGVKHFLKTVSASLGVANRRPSLAFMAHVIGAVGEQDENIPSPATLDKNVFAKRLACMPHESWFELKGSRDLQAGDLHSIHYRDGVIAIKETTGYAPTDVKAWALRGLGVDATDIRALRLRQRPIRRAEETPAIIRGGQEYDQIVNVGIRKAFESKLFTLAAPTSYALPFSGANLAKMHEYSQGRSLSSYAERNAEGEAYLRRVLDKEQIDCGLRNDQETLFYLYATEQLPLSAARRAQLNVR